MKKIKKILVALLAMLCLTCTVGILTSCFELMDTLLFYGLYEQEGDFAFCLRSDGTYEVKGANKNLTTAEIPSTYNGKPVTIIGARAFSGYTQLKRAVIPDGIVEIEDSAFEYCSALTEITIPESLQEIGMFAFNDCDSIATVYWNAIDCKKNRSDWGVFKGSPVFTKLVIGEKVMSIPDHAFQDSSALTEIVFPEGVESVGKYAFCACSALTEITLPESVKTIGDHAFLRCSSLTEMTLPDGVTTVGEYAFAYCAGLTKATLGIGEITVGKYAFYQCGALESVTLKNTEEWCVSPSPLFNAVTALTAEELSDEAAAATYFSSTYCVYYWKCVKE